VTNLGIGRKWELLRKLGNYSSKKGLPVVEKTFVDKTENWVNEVNEVLGSPSFSRNIRKHSTGCFCPAVPE